jgi:hypothetical protein
MPTKPMSWLKMLLLLEILLLQLQANRKDQAKMLAHT